MKLNTVVEGTYPDIPQVINVCGIELQIPINARVLRIRERERYILYGTTQDFLDLRIVQSPIFVGVKGYDDGKKIPGGWDLREHCENIGWVHDNQRSLLTRDGRLYVETIYFHEDWRWYLDRVPEILHKAKKIFDVDSNEVNNSY